MDSEITYTQAFEELQILVAEIERGEISIDGLSERVRRATILISICKQKLNETEADVNSILKELETGK